MITPRFRLSQCDKTVSICIRAPYCSLRDLDVSVEENTFLFYCTPYYLRLVLPGALEDNENNESSFNSDTGEFTFTYEKTNSGEHFPDLNFITKLLCPKLEVEENGQKIEVLSSDLPNEDLDQAEDTDQVENVKREYGFAMLGCFKFTISSEFTDVFEIDPHVTTLEDRRKLRLQSEKEKFDFDHYLADMFENDEISELANLTTPWKDLTEKQLNFSDKELDFLKDLPNKNYNLNEQQIMYCHNSLIDILYAYCYDRRTTYFEGTCESGWTISKLSSSLSWFDSFTTPKEAAISAFRRSLIYPLYREYNLSKQILNDLKVLLQIGEMYIVKCLINIYDIFQNSDSRFYIINDLFIKDYIIYVMKWDKSLWANTVAAVKNLDIEKLDLGLNLAQIEEEASYDQLTSKMTSLCVSAQDDSDDTDDSDSSDDFDSESSSSDTTDD